MVLHKNAAGVVLHVGDAFLCLDSSHLYKFAGPEERKKEMLLKN
jgi:hypothetical protein